MRLKYKKMILLLTMGVMGIGMLTISFDKTSQADQSALETGSSQVVMLNEGDMASTTPTPTTGPTNTPTPIPKDPKKLKLNDQAEIDTLIQTYYSAMLDTDEEMLASIMTDASVINIEVISKKLEYISDYHNIICYTKPGVKDGDYVVYATHEMEVASIETYAPSIDQFYVTTVDGKLYLCFGDLETDILALLQEYIKSEEVKELIAKVNLAFKEACDRDQDLKDFYINLTSSIQSADPSGTPEAEESSEASTTN